MEWIDERGSYVTHNNHCTVVDLQKMYDGQYLFYWIINKKSIETIIQRFSKEEVGEEMVEKDNQINQINAQFTSSIFMTHISRFDRRVF